ncbi:MAG TPA: Gfo/Idh/MocA family oxidoreductase [Gemmatimonadaceae bacterium]|nr:Gfo/Idh/MocA family oxidoreductase [Gemmatimonadaceae bacterium]
MSEHAGPRAAIIGAGLMGRWHADAVRRIGGQVTVIVDPDDTARDALGRRHPEARLVAELDASLLARHATAAHVCTPLPTHGDIVSSAIQAGLHTLVEKPFARNAAETTDLLELAQQRRVITCPVHQFVFQEGVRQITEWLPSLGRIQRVEFSTCSAGAPTTDPVSLDWLVAEILPHPLSLVSALLGLPLASSSWQVVHPIPGELRAITTVAGAIVSIAISAHSRPTENVLRVLGSAGSATADLFHGFAVRRNGAVSRRTKITQPFIVAGKTFASATINVARRTLQREFAYPGLRELVQQFYSATRGERPTPLSPASIADVACARDRILAPLSSTPAD